jgi:triacylglycerol lipase
MRARFILLVTLLTLALVATPAAAHHSPSHGGGPGGGDGGGEDGGSGDAGGGTGRDPIVFVHGWTGSSSSFATMMDRFRADGYTDDELFAWDYNWSQSNKTTAGQLEAYIDSVLAITGAARVDVITHSMGGLSSRWCIKYDGCEGKVDAWVSLGGPNHGTNTAYGCFTTSCVEMRPGSRFLRDLNRGDETPGELTRWTTWWSACDTVIDPSESTILDGAANTRTACISHSALLTDATVYGQVRDLVASS